MTTESSLITNTLTQSGFLLLSSDEGLQKMNGNFHEILLKTKSLILPTIIVRITTKILQDSLIHQGRWRGLPSTERSSSPS